MSGPDHADRKTGEPVDPSKLFRTLRDRPTPEIDSREMWQRLNAVLSSRQRHRRRGLRVGQWVSTWPVPRLAFGAAAIAAVVMGIWLRGLPTVTEGVGSSSQTPNDAASSGREEAGTVVDLVELQPLHPEDHALEISAPGGNAAADSTTDRRAPIPQASPAEEGGTPAPGSVVEVALADLRLDVRLVRGFESPLSAEDSRNRELLGGAGGASSLTDLRSQLLPLLPFESYALIGRWQGDLPPGERLSVALSDRYGLDFAVDTPAVGDRVSDSSPADEISWALTDVQLRGAGQPRVATKLVLEPDRLYLFGVRSQAESAPSLILALRLHTDD